MYTYYSVFNQNKIHAQLVKIDTIYKNIILLDTINKQKFFFIKFSEHYSGLISLNCMQLPSAYLTKSALCAITHFRSWIVSASA